MSMEYPIEIENVTPGMVVRFDYTCADGSGRSRVGVVDKVTSSGIVLLLDDRKEYRTHAKERIKNLHALAPVAPAGWDSI